MYLSSFQATANAAIPEPGTVSLLLGGVTLAIATRRWKR